MKTLGLIGGMSWESSLEYYRLVNEGVKSQLGGLHSSRLIMYSVDFAEVEILQSEGRWEEAAQMMIDAAQALQRGGADGLLICTNTMHKSAPQVEAAVSIPLIHIADAAGAAVHKNGIQKIGLLGTRFTMEEDFIVGRLASRYNLDVIVPNREDRDVIHRVIYDELCLGLVKDSSRQAYIEIIQRLQTRGAAGVILGCTEIGLLVRPQDSPLPLFDTTLLHAQAAVTWQLGNG